MKQPIYDLRNSLMHNVVLYLSCGRIVKGIIPPAFWVRNGYIKLTYPQSGADAIAIIPDEFSKEYLPRFRDGNMLFEELPKGYEEIPIGHIDKIEILVAKSQADRST